MKTRKIYSEIASLLNARANCERSGNTEWHAKHEAKILEIAKELLPSGSGFDCGTKVDLEASTDEKIILLTSFHHMDEMGGYDGWTEHKVTIRPSLAFGYTLTISGKNKNDIKSYMHDVFNMALDADCTL